MVRLVSTQTGARRSRVRVISRHVTVRHQPSDAFLLDLKNRRIQRILAEFEPLEREQDRTHLSEEGEGVSELLERPIAHVNGQEVTQLPRLGAYLDQVAEQVPSERLSPTVTERPRSEISSIRERKDRMPKSTGRSAYEELRAKWGRI